MKDIDKYLDQLSDHDQKYYRHRFKTLTEAQQIALAELADKLHAAGATKPLTWAWSEVTEGIPQFARFRVLQELFLTARDTAGNMDCAADFEPDASEIFQEVVAALGEEKANRFLAAYGKGMLQNLVGVFDEGNSESGRDGFGWRLMKTGEDGDEVIRGIDGLHEDLMEFDQEIR